MHTNGADLKQTDTLAMPLYSSHDKPLWREIDDSIDVVALELKSAEVKRFVIHAFSPLDMLTSDIIVGVGDPLIVIGYPH